MNRGPIVLILVAVLAFLGLNSFFVVNEREQAIVLRFGEIKRVETDPGLYFKLPFTMFDLETVQIVDDRLLRFDLDNITVQVSGGKFYEVNAFVTYIIADAARFRGQVSGQLALAEDRLRTRSERRLA